MTAVPVQPVFYNPLITALEGELGPRYAIRRVLSGGSMALVLVAWEWALARSVVIKVLLPQLAAGVSIERFRREIAVAASLQHPHIVPVLAAGETCGLPFFTMPFVEGETLRTHLTRRRGECHSSAPHDGIRLLREVASALACAHERQIVHRDVKPANILLSHGSAVVTDFGIARALEGGEAARGRLTSNGIAVGTPAYMSPEQACASDAIDGRADLYSFGVLAYELFTGAPTFGDRTPRALIAAHINEVPVPIRRIRPSLPVLLAELVMRCLEKDPADRPQSASEVVATLDSLTTERRSGTAIPSSYASGGRGIVHGVAAAADAIADAARARARRFFGVRLHASGQ